MKIITTLLIFILYSCQSEPDQKQMSLVQNNQKLIEKNHQLLKTLPDRNYKGIEVIYASVGKPYYSWLGHIALRLNGSGKTPQEDLVLSYLPLFNTPKVDNLKAYYGGTYPVFPQLSSFQEIRKEYVDGEKRYLDRFILKLSTEQIGKIKNQLTKLISKKDIGTFGFKRKNCTHYPMQFLASIGLRLDREKTTFPINFIYYLESLNLIEKQLPRITP